MSLKQRLDPLTCDSLSLGSMASFKLAAEFLTQILHVEFMIPEPGNALDYVAEILSWTMRPMLAMSCPKQEEHAMSVTAKRMNERGSV